MFATALVVYFSWQHLIAFFVFLLSTNPTSRTIGIKIGVTAFKTWNWLRSLALVSVSWKTYKVSLIQQPVIRFLVGHGGGGRNCGSLVVYSPPDVDEQPTTADPVPFDD